jgi:hypothetical protein
MTTFVTSQEARNFIEWAGASNVYVYVHNCFAKLQKPLPISALRIAFKSVMGIDAERAAFAIYLDRRGLQLCHRCGGAGGASQWPGYTCFDCGGKGYMEKK